MAQPQGPPIESLSRREFQVLRLICAGLDAGEIAKKLGLSPKTISTYRYRIRLKLNLKHSAELITAGLRMREKGLFSPNTASPVKGIRWWQHVPSESVAFGDVKHGAEGRPPATE